VAGESTSVTEPPPFLDQERVALLLTQLGDTRYVTRRRAEQELLQIGLPAFDQIDAATSEADPEVSASCRFLRSELTRRWTRRDDPLEVKRLVRSYSDYEENGRLAIVAQLGSLSDHLGQATLCRICRYDTSPVVARQAAIELLATTEWEPSYPADAPSLLREAIGTSRRPAATWIRLLAYQLESPSPSIPFWKEAIERNSKEAIGVAEKRASASQQLALRLHLVRLELLHGSRDDFLHAVASLLEASSETFEPTFAKLAEWTVAAQSSDRLDALFDTYESKLANSKGGLYTAAMARAKQGKTDLAEKLANAAFERPPSEPTRNPSDEALQQASQLQAKGYVEWARRELRRVVKEATVASVPHATACYLLANSLHDWQLDEEAADTLDIITNALKTNATARKTYNQRALQQNRRFQQRAPSYDTLVAYSHFYRACHYQAEGNRDQQWKSLEQAIKVGPNDIDILIAMYHASEDNPERRRQVKERMKKRLQMVEHQIEDHSNDANACNEWAWLVSNTEGDFEKAVRYSLRSLEVSPGSAGLLDTLACCYFAAGDLEKAIQHQSRAVKLSPHLQVLRRQLTRFEKTMKESEQ